MPRLRGFCHDRRAQLLGRADFDPTIRFQDPLVITINFSFFNSYIRKSVRCDLYWMNVETGKRVRLTFAPGADVLPVFSPDGKKVMWTSTRDGMKPAQLYIAD